MLDLKVTRAGEWSWKDEDEAEEAVLAGRLTADELKRLRAEGERLGELADARLFPFDGTWTDFSPDPAWPRPLLPGGLVGGS